MVPSNYVQYINLLSVLPVFPRILSQASQKQIRKTVVDERIIPCHSSINPAGHCYHGPFPPAASTSATVTSAMAAPLHEWRGTVGKHFSLGQLSVWGFRCFGSGGISKFHCYQKVSDFSRLAVSTCRWRANMCGYHGAPCLESIMGPP